MKFTKMHGAGNDYVYVNCFDETLPESAPELAKKVADRRFGIGGDGLILIEPSKTADATMRMFNADGSEAEMCGNGLRCVAKYVYDHGICQRDHLKLQTGAGVLSVDLTTTSEHGRSVVDSITVDMGPPILQPEKIPTTLVPTGDLPSIVEQEVEFGDRRLKVTAVSMGNPHCIIFVPEASDELVLEVGPQIEADPRFPARTNVEFVEVISRTELRQRTWERGSGETWACGTGASAVCVAGVLAGHTEREVLIHLLGGDLRLRWDEGSGSVFMTGPATEVFSGTWPVAP